MSDMAKIRDEIEYSITGFDNNCVIDVFWSTSSCTPVKTWQVG